MILESGLLFLTTLYVFLWLCVQACTTVAKKSNTKISNKMTNWLRAEATHVVLIFSDVRYNPRDSYIFVLWFIPRSLNY